MHTDHQSLISLVAETDDNSISGQVIISKITAEKDNKLKIYGLAPMCVALRYQHQEIGTKFIEIIIKEARKNNIDAIFVLGHPSYYPKFGFKPAREYKIKYEYDVPADVFMVLNL